MLQYLSRIFWPFFARTAPPSSGGGAVSPGSLLKKGRVIQTKPLLGVARIRMSVAGCNVIARKRVLWGTHGHQLVTQLNYGSETQLLYYTRRQKISAPATVDEKLTINWRSFRRSVASLYRVAQKKNCTKFNAPSFCNRLTRFAPTGPGWPKISDRRGRPHTNHSSSQKTRLNDLSYGIKIWTDFFFRLVKIHAFGRRSDRQTEFSSLDRVCILQRRYRRSRNGSTTFTPHLW